MTCASKVIAQSEKVLVGSMFELSCRFEERGLSQIVKNAAR